MGRILIIIVLMVIVIISIILHSNYTKSSEVIPELFDSYHQKQARNLAGYALNIGIAEFLKQEAISLEDLNYGQLTPHPDIQNVLILEGVINSITYTSVDAAKDTIKVYSNITWNGKPDHPITWESSVTFNYAEIFNSSVPGNFFDHAAIYKGSIRQHSHSIIDGDTLHLPQLEFDDIFGLSLTKIKNLPTAEYIQGDISLRNNSPQRFHGGIYIIDGNLDSNRAKMGTGIIIVTGTTIIRAGSTFNGIIISLGHFTNITPKNQFIGTAIALQAPGESLWLQAHAGITYNSDIVYNLLEFNNLSADSGGSGSGSGQIEQLLKLLKYIE